MGRSYRDMTRDEEVELCKRYQNGDNSAVETLIRAHEPFLRNIAWFYVRKYGQALEDMMQECRMGCVKAASRFQEGKGVRFLTYAQYWARHYAGRTCQDQCGCIRIPVHAQQSGRQHPIFGISLGSPAYHGRDQTIGEMLPAPDLDPEDVAIANEATAQAKAMVHAAMRRLNERERLIMRARVMTHRNEPGYMTLEALGVRLGVTRERARQIENIAKAKLRAALQCEKVVAERERKARRIRSVREQRAG